MTTKFEHKGKWRLPNNPEWINGTLTFDPENGSELELFGSFNNFLDNSTKEIIIGKTTNGNITLVDNWYKGCKNVHEGKITIGKYNPQLVFIGQLFEHKDEIKFNRIIFKVFNLFQWLSLSGQNVNIIDESKHFEIKYKEIPQIDFKLKENCNAKISFDSPISSKIENNIVNLYEEVYVTFDYKKSEKYLEILNDVNNFISFITIATFEQSYPLSLAFQDDRFIKKTGYTDRLEFIKLHYSNRNYNSNLKLRYQGEHIVMFKDIESKFSKIIENWMNLFSDFESVIILILRYFKNKFLFTEEKFIDVIKAIENFHRIEYNNERIPIKELDILIENILSQVNLNGDDLKWLESKLIGNEPNLKHRIKELINNNKNKFTNDNSKNLKRLYYHATNSRNYYTHYDNEKKASALDGKELYDVTTKLFGLLISCFLNKIEIEPKDYEENLVTILM
jgi:hypothetical protein